MLVEQLREKHPTFFGVALGLAVWIAWLVAPICGLVSRMIPYPTGAIAQCDLVLPADTVWRLQWLRWGSLTVGVAMAGAVLIAALGSGLPRRARRLLAVLGAALLCINVACGVLIHLAT